MRCGELKVIAFLVVLLAVFQRIQRVEALLTTTEGNILLDLINSVTGLPANWRADQVRSACDNGWTGLRCTFDILGTQRLSIINLGYRLTGGTIPASLIQLTRLDQLIMDGNFLSGPIPDEIGTAPQLDIFSAFDNELTGTIPASLWKIQNIRIHTNQLTGPIPEVPDDGQTKRPTEFLANGNRLSGIIPESFFLLNRMQLVDVSDNPLGGTISEQIGNFTLLRNFNAKNAQLEGTIPEIIGQLVSLTAVSLAENSLSGTIPESFGNLTKLQTLELYETGLSGTIPPAIFSFQALKILDVHGNQLDGTISEQLNMTSIRSLNMYSNQFTGTLPPSISLATGLSQIQLQGNRFYGSIPDSIGSITSLRTIDMSSNQFEGSIPATIGNIASLTSLKFRDNFISGTIPDSIGFCTFLQEISLANNQLTGPIPETIGNLSALASLDLQNNQLTDAIPLSLGGLSRLKTLLLSSNQLTGEIPPTFAQLTSLLNLQVQNNALTGNFPTFFDQTPNLQVLNMEGNSIGGTLPANIGVLSSLQQLLLRGNGLTGTIPSTLSGLRANLREIVLSDNELSGTIPPTIGTLANVQLLDLDNNNLNGTIPETIGAMTELQQLFINNNELNGPLPASLNNMTSLETIKLRSNQISGEIPELSRLQLLTELDLAFNELSGTIPISLGSLAKLQKLTLRNNKLSGCSPMFQRKISSCEINFNTWDCNCFNGSLCAVQDLTEYPCPIETVPPSTDSLRDGLVAGIVVGVPVIVGVIILIVFLVRRKQQQGVFIQIAEPDYVKVAYGKELEPHFRSDSNYGLLSQVVTANDKSFIGYVIDITEPTEMENVAKSLIFLAHEAGTAADFCEYVSSKEVLACVSENELFRKDTMASKLFKYYSKIVGLPYIFHTLARVIKELEIVTRSKDDAAVDTGASILDIEMELDPAKIKDENADRDANLLQLLLTCQKILKVIFSQESRVPPEFRTFFNSLKSVIASRFGSTDAVYKALGNFLFLRFIIPSIAVPSAYGILDAPPNAKCHRQLVLIGKTIQNVANMSSQTKESFMEEMNDFRLKNVPKMKIFYDNIMDAARIGMGENRAPLEVPDVVKSNSLAYLHYHIVTKEKFIRERISKIDDQGHKAKMDDLLTQIMQTYGSSLPKNTIGEQ